MRPAMIVSGDSDPGAGFVVTGDAGVTGIPGDAGLRVRFTGVMQEDVR